MQLPHKHQSLSLLSCGSHPVPGVDGARRNPTNILSTGDEGRRDT